MSVWETIQIILISIFFVIVFFAVPLFLILHYGKKIEEEMKEKYRVLFFEKRDKLIDAGGYKFIEGFVKRYGYDKFFVKDARMENGKVVFIEYDAKIDPIQFSTQLDKLKELIRKKTGMEFDEWELRQLLGEEAINQCYEHFKTKMLMNNPQTIEDYIKTFLGLYTDKIEEYIKYFVLLLREKGFYYPVNELMKMIDEEKENLELLRFEKLLCSDNPYIPSLDELQQMSGQEFERFLKRFFEMMGYTVEQTKVSGDQGADLIINKFGERIVVQAKRHSKKVGNKAIQEVTAAVKHYNADRGMVVTTSGFTKSAIELAKSNDIELIDRTKLQKLIEKYL